MTDRRGRKRRITDQVLAWAEEQIAAGTTTKAEVLILLKCHRTTFERRLAERRRVEPPIALPPGGFRCPGCLARSKGPVCASCGLVINAILAPAPPRPPAA